MIKQYATDLKKTKKSWKLEKIKYHSSKITFHCQTSTYQVPTYKANAITLLLQNYCKAHGKKTTSKAIKEHDKH